MTDPTATDRLLNAAAAIGYAIERLPPSGSRMTQVAERRAREALAMLDAALAEAAPAPDRDDDEEGMRADIVQAGSGGPDFTPKEWPAPDLIAAVEALPIKTPAACSCDIGDGEWVPGRGCVGCGHAGHASDECERTVQRAMGLTEYRAAVLALLRSTSREADR